MNHLIRTTIIVVVAVALGVVIGRWDSADEAVSDSSNGGRTVLYWKAPMDPNYKRDEPGKSPMGMDLVPVYADEVAGEDADVVVISPTVVNNLGVRTGAVEHSVLSRRIDTVGYVGYDEDTVRQVNTRVDGWIEKLAIKASGDPVRKGQVLFELYSPTLVNAQEEFLAALQSHNEALHDASRERLAALGVGAGEIQRLEREKSVRQRVRIVAQADGVVAHLGVREGIYVTPASAVMSIAELDQIWVLAEVFEREAGWVRAGQEAIVELDYLPGKQWRGVVDYVYPELDPKTRTLSVRLRFENEAEALRPNMFTRVTILATETEATVHVPREAVIRGGTVDRVVVALGEGRYRAQPVELGIESGDRVEIRSGLKFGDRVVTSGQFLIDSESNIEGALARIDQTNDAVIDHSEHPASEPVDHIPQQMDDSKIDDEQPIDVPMDHSQHQVSEPMDHSRHQVSEPMDHSQHQMDATGTTDGVPANGAMSHDEHPMEMEQ